MKNNTKFSLNNRPPIEEFYKEEIANNTIRYEKTPNAKQKLIALLVLGSLCVLIFQYKIFPTINLASKNCELWYDIDPTFFLFYIIFFFPLILDLIILLKTVKELKHVIMYREKFLQRNGYFGYKVFQKMNDKQIRVQKILLIGKMALLLIFITFIFSSAYKYNNGFFGMNTQIQHPLNPLNLKQNSQIMQKLCLAKIPMAK